MALWDNPFLVVTDAINLVIGAVLEQEGRLVGYYSCKLNAAKENFSIYDKELLGVMSAFKHWKHFLY